MLSMVVMYIIIHANLIITNNKPFIPHQNRQALFDNSRYKYFHSCSIIFCTIQDHSCSF